MTADGTEWSAGTPRLMRPLHGSAGRSARCLLFLPRHEAPSNAIRVSARTKAPRQPLWLAGRPRLALTAGDPEEHPAVVLSGKWLSGAHLDLNRRADPAGAG